MTHLTRGSKIQPQKQDEEWIWGNHRGGGGDPVRGLNGAPISKLGLVLNGNTQIDLNRYNGGDQRPSTSHHLPASVSMFPKKHHGHNIFDPSPIISSGGKATADLSHHQSSMLPVKTTLGIEHTPIAPKIRMENPLKPPTYLMESTLSIPDPDYHLPTSEIQSSVVDSTSSPPYSEQTVQRQILEEISQLKIITRKHTMLEALRWGLNNLHMIDNVACIGTIAGTNTQPINLSELIRIILIEFMKGRSYNLGNRTLRSKTGEIGEEEFRHLLSDSILLLMGTAPRFSRRPNGDFDIYPGDYL